MNLIILYQEDKGLDAFDVFARFGQLLREKGYDTSEKIDRLVNEIKRETTEDWLRRCLRVPYASGVPGQTFDEGG